VEAWQLLLAAAAGPLHTLILYARPPDSELVLTYMSDASGTFFAARASVLTAMLRPGRSSGSWGPSCCPTPACSMCAAAKEARMIVFSSTPLLSGSDRQLYSRFHTSSGLLLLKPRHCQEPGGHKSDPRMGHQPYSRVELGPLRPLPSQRLVTKVAAMTKCDRRALLVRL
jgi:hypothetical protein